MKRKITRLIDANLNRAKEAIRVCEEISRFIIEDTSLTRSFKSLRHRITQAARSLPLNIGALLDSRNTKSDVGKKNIVLEYRRKDINDVFFANMQRLKESIRVLEEFSKVINKKTSQKFKTIRFSIYALEKKTSKFLSVLRHR